MSINKSELALELLKQLEVKQKQANELRLLLTKSLAIKELWPEAFELGAVKVRREVTHRGFGRPIPTLTALIITRPDGVSRTIPVADLPEILKEPLR